MNKRYILIIFWVYALFSVYSPAYAVDVGQPIPKCDVTALGGGQTFDLSRYKGKVLYVDFWASWCGPCAKSFPFLNEMHQQFTDKGLQIVGVNLDENMDDAKAFLVKFPSSFTVMADISKECAKGFDVKAMPSSYLIDRKGNVQHIHMGFRSGEAKDIRAQVEKLLAD
jgi:thiol-disulfide isomerase/thioredoxin